MISLLHSQKEKITHMPGVIIETISGNLIRGTIPDAGIKGVSDAASRLKNQGYIEVDVVDGNATGRSGKTAVLLAGVASITFS